MPDRFRPDAALWALTPKIERDRLKWHEDWCRCRDCAPAAWASGPDRFEEAARLARAAAEQAGTDF